VLSFHDSWHWHPHATASDDDAPVEANVIEGGTKSHGHLERDTTHLGGGNPPRTVVTDAVGYLIYTADGRFSVMISRAGRPGFAANDLFGGTMPERAQGFVAYAGRYRFDGDRVVHHVELSLFPNWVGSDQERAVELSGPVDPERQPAAAWGKVAGARLVWERVHPSSAITS
jgi:hypothetical protein